MFRVFVYLFPVLENFILYGALIGTAQQLARQGCDGIYLTAVTAIWALVYSLAAAVMSRFADERRAAVEIAIGLAGMAVGAFGLIFASTPLHFYTLIAWIGVFSVVYCVPFQIFMKAAERGADGAVVRPAALYTASWSFGAAAGPFVLSSVSFSGGCVVGVVLGVTGALGALVMGRWYRRVSVQQPPVRRGSETGADDFSRYPDLAWLGWCAGGVCVLVAATMRMLIPYQTRFLELPMSLSGTSLAIIFAVQGVAVLAFANSKRWMFKPVPALICALCGVIGLGCFAFGRSAADFGVGALFYGIHSAMFYFYFVCYALANPVKSGRHVAVNEAVVGVASVLSLAGGALTGHGSARGTLLLGAALVAIVMLFQALALRKLVKFR